MNNRLDKLLDANKNILTLYLTSGYPDKEISNDIAQILLKSNIDILEIGIPFSDPIADGPTIQNTSYKAINSINEPIIDFTFNTIETLRKINNEKPIILMSYLNLIYQYGIENFAVKAKQNGADAVVIPDLPYEESNSIKNVLDNYNIHLIYMVTPTSSDKTISEISKNAKGFIYYVSSTGVTGSRETLSDKNFENSFDAKVKELIYLGDHIRTRVEVCGNDQFIVKVPNSYKGANLKEGTSVKLSWKASDSRALDLG